MRGKRALLAGAAALGVSLVSAGCTPMEWVRPDATPEQREQDERFCEQEAWREARWRSWYYQPFPMAPFRDASGRRFFPGPYSDPFNDPFLEEGRLAQFCMRSKGYELVPVEPAQ
jgi:hypothetical protein